MSEVEVNDVPPPQPEVKRGRGRPAGSLSKTPKKPVDENYHNQFTTIRSHNTSSFCSKYLRNKTQ